MVGPLGNVTYLHTKTGEGNRSCNIGLRQPGNTLEAAKYNHNITVIVAINYVPISENISESHQIHQ
jgi:hypothetical protein